MGRPPNILNLVIKSNPYFYQISEHLFSGTSSKHSKYRNLAIKIVDCILVELAEDIIQITLLLCPNSTYRNHF